LAERHLIQFSIDYSKKFLNWLRTSCVVSIATWHIWTADFWADFEQRIIDRAINERQKDCRAVSMPKDSIQTHVVTVDTAKHFIIPIKTLVVQKIYLFQFPYIRQHKLWNDMQLRTATVTHFSWYIATNNCFLMLWFM